MFELSNVENFGGIDADTDALLDECFEDHEAYISARGHKKFLILGKKGSGKTAIFKKIITSRGSEVFSFGHNFSDYPWHYHNKQKKIGVPAEQCFQHSWEYLILITLAKVLLNQDNSQPWSDAAMDDLGKLESFIIDTYGSRDPDVGQVFSPARTIKLKPHFKISAGFFSGGVNPELIPMEQLPIIVQEINNNLLDAMIRCLNPKIDYFICFDELDLGFSKTDPDYSLRLIGLLLAARKMNIRGRDSGKRLSVLVFLRDDIFSTLQFEDKNKLTEAAAARIEWDTPQTQHTLKSLMERRFSNVFEIPIQGAWESVFDESKEMTGHQTKYQHIIDRTFLRPRDIIKFCNEVLNAHRNSGNPTTDKFDNKDVIDARRSYSDYFIRELDDEIHKHIPDYKTYLEILKSLDSLQFELTDFVAACQKRAQILTDRITPTDILSQLFEFSVIGCYRPGGGGFGGAEYVWRYKDSRAAFNENAGRYRVHAGLMETLGLKKFSRSG